MTLDLSLSVSMWVREREKEGGSEGDMEERWGDGSVCLSVS